MRTRRGWWITQESNIEDAGFAEGLTCSLYKADWLWANNTDPKNASFFSFYSTTPDDTNQNSRYLVMHLQDSNKVFKSSEDVVKSTKQYIRAPQTYQELLDSIKMFTTFLKGFHGENSEPAVKCEIAYKLVSENPVTFKSRCVQDNTFASAFLYKMDKRYQLFMKECRNVEERDMVSQRTLDYETLIENVKMGDFVSYLPKVFTVAGDTKRKLDNATGGGGDEHRQRRGKQGKDSKDGSQVVNKEADESLKLTDDEWKKISGNKELLKLRPKLTGDAFMCHRWECRGYCFLNCPNVAAHLPKSESPSEKQGAIKGWVDKARKAAKSSN
jgi:hypothetical protein